MAVTPMQFLDFLGIKSIGMGEFPRLLYEFSGFRSFLKNSTSICHLISHASRNILASASADKLVKIWDLATETCKMTMEHHTDKVTLVLQIILC